MKWFQPNFVSLGCPSVSAKEEREPVLFVAAPELCMLRFRSFLESALPHWQPRPLILNTDHGNLLGTGNMGKESRATRQFASNQVQQKGRVGDSPV